MTQFLERFSNTLKTIDKCWPLLFTEEVIFAVMQRWASQTEIRICENIKTSTMPRDQSAVNKWRKMCDKSGWKWNFNGSSSDDGVG